MREVVLPQPGRCYCGALRLQLTALPYFSYLCHCSICRRRTGAAYGISTPVPSGAVEIVAGETTFQRRTYSDGTEGGTVSCAACSSKVYSCRDGSFYWTFRPGLLDDSSWVTPVGQMWTADALPWALLEGVPSFEGEPPGVQAFTDAWRALDVRAVARS